MDEVNKDNLASLLNFLKTQQSQKPVALKGHLLLVFGESPDVTRVMPMEEVSAFLRERGFETAQVNTLLMQIPYNAAEGIKLLLEALAAAISNCQKCSEKENTDEDRQP